MLAKICVATRPALTLGEVMNQEQLERLILLAVQHDHVQGPSAWGGPWAAHSITCLLLDILEGMYIDHLLICFPQKVRETKSVCHAKPNHVHKSNFVVIIKPVRSKGYYL